MKKTYLYLDDERIPVTNHPWIIVRSFIEAVQYVKDNGIPDVISFDHDLGTDQTGYDFAKWLVERDLDNKFTFPNNFEFNVHSANPVGRDNINGLLSAYMQYKIL